MRNPPVDQLVDPFSDPTATDALSGAAATGPFGSCPECCFALELVDRCGICGTNATSPAKRTPQIGVPCDHCGEHGRVTVPSCPACRYLPDNDRIPTHLRAALQP